MKPKTLRFKAEGMHRPANVTLGPCPVSLSCGTCLYLGVGSEDIFLTVEQATALAETLLHNVECIKSGIKAK